MSSDRGKTPVADLKGRYREIFKKSLVLSLASFLLLLLTFKGVKIRGYQPTMRVVETIEVEDIPETHQRRSPPPPPEPEVPIVAKGEELSKDVTIAETELKVPVPPPSPPEPPSEPWYVEEMPQPVKLVKPEYPEMARRAGVEGLVILHLLIDVDGSVIRVKVAKPSGEAGFEEAAVEAAWKCKFTPGKQNGRPVRVWVSLPFRFELQD